MVKFERDLDPEGAIQRKGRNGLVSGVCSFPSCEGARKFGVVEWQCKRRFK